ncbi:hypothetical protein ACFV4K_05800 [Nocardia sp. NPDC059764]|uniref:hypothetical protein n=1 Tax=Nocardia sp. NPDC059764 TaxID=3346939 RepID=UPI003652D3A7
MHIAHHTHPNGMGCFVTVSSTGNRVPAAEASDGEFIEFAHTYNGYEAFSTTPEGLGETVGEVRLIWNRLGELPDDLNLLRACLFLEVRGHRHRGDDAPFKDDRFVQALVDRIRDMWS